MELYKFSSVIYEQQRFHALPPAGLAERSGGVALSARQIGMLGEAERGRAGPGWDGDVSLLPKEDSIKEGSEERGHWVCLAALTSYTPRRLQFHSALLPSISSHSMALSHLCQLIIGPLFVIMYCSLRRERGG